MSRVHSPQFSNNVEVSQEDFRAVLGDKCTDSASRRKKSPSKGSMAKMLGNILSPKKSSRNKPGRSASSGSSNASMAVIGDNESIFSAEGQQSVAVTVSSQVTIKASNRKEKLKSDEPGKSQSNGWKTFKRLVGVKTTLFPDGPLRERVKSMDIDSERSTKSAGYSMRKRVLSVDGVSQWAARSLRGGTSRDISSAKSSVSARVTSQLDIAIRGRLDGVDILSLGPASRSSLSPTRSASEVQRSPSKKYSPKNLLGKLKEDPELDFDFDPLELSFTGMPTSCTCADIVSDMIWASAGKEQPELIFEGYIPGGSDRWSVKVEDPQKFPEAPSSERSSSLPTAQSFDDDESTAVLTDDGSTNLSAQKLWDHIWGEETPPPAPSHMQSAGNGEEDDVLHLAAACSVPIDLDEDTFIIDTPAHLRSVHELAMIPLQARRFNSALCILDKLLKGLEEPSNKTKFEHLIGCTHHNVGIIQMCQGHFIFALESFQKAVVVRTRCLPQNHPDVAVSLMRQGDAYFALENFKEAVKSFELALGMCPAEDATRAKILNNIGVVHYQRKNHAGALKAFTSALEIQRQWLDGPVRREFVVYDAAVTLGNMGKVFLSKGAYDLSYSVFEEACLLQTTGFRKDHDIVLASLRNMALIYAKNEQYAKSEPILRGILRSQESRFGPNSEHTIETIGTLGFVLMKRMDFEEGLRKLRKVLAWQKNQLPPLHPSVRLTLDAIQTVEQYMSGKTLWV